MAKFTAQSDPQTLGLLKVGIWSNAACVGLLVAINLLNYLRKGGALGSASADGMQWGDGFTPEFFLVLSAGLSVYLILSAIRVYRTRQRLSHMRLTIDDDRVEGISMGNPMESDRTYPNGRPFSMRISELIDVRMEDVHITKRQTTPCLVLITREDTCRVPAIAEMETALETLQTAMEEARTDGN